MGVARAEAVLTLRTQGPQLRRDLPTPGLTQAAVPLGLALGRGTDAVSPLQIRRAGPPRRRRKRRRKRAERYPNPGVPWGGRARPAALTPRCAPAGGRQGGKEEEQAEEEPGAGGRQGQGRAAAAAPGPAEDRPGRAGGLPGRRRARRPPPRRRRLRGALGPAPPRGPRAPSALGAGPALQGGAAGSRSPALLRDGTGRGGP